MSARASIEPYSDEQCNKPTHWLLLSFCRAFAVLMGFVPLMVWSRNVLPPIRAAQGLEPLPAAGGRLGALIKRLMDVALIKRFMFVLFSPVDLLMLPSKPDFWKHAGAYIYSFRHVCLLAWLAYFMLMGYGIMNISVSAGMPDVFGAERNNMPRKRISGCGPTLCLTPI